MATDWPGHVPGGPATVALLVAAGAEVDARFGGGSHDETPLHWAASSDDVEVLDALLDAGADIDAAGGVIAGDTPLADAWAFGQWRAAHRLVERGARTTIDDAATLGLLDRLEGYFTGTGPATDEVDRAFRGACHGGQRLRRVPAGAGARGPGRLRVVPLSQVNANVSDERLWSLRRDGFSAVYADIGEYLRRFVAPASSLAVHAACRRVSDATAGDTCDCGHRLPQAPQYW